MRLSLKSLPRELTQVIQDVLQDGTSGNTGSGCGTHPLLEPDELESEPAQDDKDRHGENEA